MHAENENQNATSAGAAEFLGKSLADIRLLSEQGNFQASHRIGTMYCTGEGVEKDEDEASKWWRLADRQRHDANILAAEKGDIEAQYDLGMEYAWGSWAVDDNTIEYNDAEARKWYLMAAEQGHPQAQYELGAHYSQNGSNLPGNPEECQRWMHMAAEQGEVQAMCWLGHKFSVGEDGAPLDLVEAAKWYRLAAEQGDQFAMFNLGCIYEEGQGINPDFSEAMKWYGLSADQGNTLAQFRLGVMYAEAKGVPQDDERAVELYALAANQGHAEAQNNLGAMYNAGHGIRQDSRKAARWFRKGAAQGNATAQFNLGLMYQEGSGVVKNEAKAVKWYRLAAEQGYPWAALALGLLGKTHESLKEAAKGLFSLHYSEEFRPLRESQAQLEDFKFRLADLIAAKSQEHSRSGPSASIESIEGKDRPAPLVEWKVASTLRGMLELISQSTDPLTARADLERSLREGDPLAGYYLAVLCSYKPHNLFSQTQALDYLKQTMSLLQSYGDLCRAIRKDDKKNESTPDSPYYGKEFEAWLLGAARQKHSEIKLTLEKEETHKQTLSFLTHTLNNALSTGPETVRTVIEILGSDLYDQGQAGYKAINNMASLFPVFLFAESLLKTFKLYVSDPEQVREKWKSDRVGDATVSLVMAMALRQSVARFVFSPNHLAQLKRLLPERDKEAIKNVRKSFVEEIIPQEVTLATVGKMFDWVKVHFGLLHVEIDPDAEMSFGSNATRYMFFFAAFSELIYNALKYSDGARPIEVKWFREGADYCFTCRNSFDAAVSGKMSQDGTNKGLFFVDKLMSMLDGSALKYGHQDADFMASLRFGHDNFGESKG